MKVFRAVPGTTQYSVVGHDGPRPINSGLNTFATNLAVEPGDILGLNSGGPSSNACEFFPFPNDGYRFLGGDLPDGASGSFLNSPNGRPNIQAELTAQTSATTTTTTTTKKKKCKKKKKKHSAQSAKKKCKKKKKK